MKICEELKNIQRRCGMGLNLWLCVLILQQRSSSAFKPVISTLTTCQGATLVCQKWQINERWNHQIKILSIQPLSPSGGLSLNFLFVPQSSLSAVTWSFGYFPAGQPSAALKNERSISWVGAEACSRVLLHEYSYLHLLNYRQLPGQVGHHFA